MDRQPSSSTPFVGRRSPLAVVRQAFDRCVASGATLVAIEAPPDHGKSAFLRQVGRELDEVATVVRIAPTEPEQSVPMGLLQHLRATLAVRIPWVPVDVELDDNDPLSAGARLLGLVSDHIGGPVAVVVDDLQWADEESVTALTFAFRRLGRAPLLALVAFRPGEGPTDLVRRLAIHEGQLLSLSGFSADEITELGGYLDHDLSRPAAVRLRTHTEGNPRHVRSLLEELSTDELERAELPIPRELTAIVAAQLDSCSQPGRDLLAAVSVLDAPCRLIDAVIVSAIDAPEAALADAVATGLITCLPSTTGLIVSMERPIVALAVLGLVPPAQTLALHRRAAAQLGGNAALRHEIAAAIVPASARAEPMAQAAVTEASMAEAASGPGSRADANQLRSAQPDEPAADRMPEGRELLSGREVAVSTLVVTGRTNRQVAEELFVSVKTVEFHLGNVYAKLGVRTRTELAAWWLANQPDG